MVIDLELFQLTEPTPEGIARQVKHLINSGEVSLGSQLPPVHELAKFLAVSIGTISAAWAILRQQNMINGVGRQGLVIVRNSTTAIPLRFANLDTFNQPIHLDLSYTAADRILIPDLSEAMQQAVKSSDLHHYEQEDITPELYQAIHTIWPYEAQGYIAINSIQEGLELLLKMWAVVGTTIAVETPVLASILDLIKQYPAKIIPVGCDKQGPIVSELEQALKKKPVLFLYQPRTHLPCGHTVSLKRLKEINNLLQGHNTVMVEMDLIGDISKTKSLSIGSYWPEQTIYIRSYSRVYGTDFCISVLSASASIIQQIKHYRGFTIGWTSRLFQNALAWLLQDPKTQKQINKAKKIYNQRQQMLIESLFAKGIDIIDSNNINLWLPVYSESFALASLSSKGIRVLGGSYLGMSKKTPHIRVATTLLPADKVEWVAEALKNVVRQD